MARDTSTDTITDDLIQRYVTILSQLTGWGTLSDDSRAVYPQLGLPQPQEPFPACYVYLGGQQHDFSLLHQGIRRDLNTINLRIIGGMSTPGTRIASGVLVGEVPEIAVYKMITAVVNELTYRPFLEDPTDNNAPFRYADPNHPPSVGQIGRIQAFSYSDQGSFIGIEIPASMALLIRLGRAG